MRSAAIIAAVSGLLALGLVNASIIQKEILLKEGQVVYLELAPVDPRSLMQGDYMALRFHVGNDIRRELRKRQERRGRSESRLESQDGTIVVVLNEDSVGRFTRFADQRLLGENERLMKFRVRNGRVKFATDAFFFQEGTADIYAQARYGEFRVAADGELLLTKLRDKHLARISHQLAED